MAIALVASQLAYWPFPSQLTQRFDELQIMRAGSPLTLWFDFIVTQGLAKRAHRLDQVGVKGPLREELDIAEPARLFAEDMDKRARVFLRYSS
jgi:hypothetical protein